MKIHHLRNATFVIESGKHYILVDPMLSKKGAMPSYTYFRNSPQRNPTISLPDNAERILSKVTLCLITHSQKLGVKALHHSDHLDKAGMSFLRKNNTPIITIEKDKQYLKNQGLNIVATLKNGASQKLLGIEIKAIPAQHGHGWIRKLMANGAGFYLQIPNEPSLYISGDTVYTKKVKKVFTELKPDISVVAAGSARLDIGKPILMSMNEILRFVKDAPNKVIANHLEAVNHCPISRNTLRHKLEKRNLLSKVNIPDDGKTIEF